MTAGEYIGASLAIALILFVGYMFYWWGMRLIGRKIKEYKWLHFIGLWMLGLFNIVMNKGEVSVFMSVVVVGFNALTFTFFIIAACYAIWKGKKLQTG